MWMKLARQVLLWRALHSLSELIARTIMVRFVQFYERRGLWVSSRSFNRKKNRGLHVVQEWESGPCTLSEGGSESDAMYNRLVGKFTLNFWQPVHICITPIRLTKMRENCLQQFDAHWECLEKRNQVCMFNNNCRLKLLTLGVYCECCDLAYGVVTNFAHLICSNL